eukprot:3172309-Pleurochrysis_carterae.AAC.1
MADKTSLSLALRRRCCSPSSFAASLIEPSIPCFGAKKSGRLCNGQILGRLRTDLVAIMHHLRSTSARFVKQTCKKRTKIVYADFQDLPPSLAHVANLCGCKVKKTKKQHGPVCTHSSRSVLA